MHLLSRTAIAVSIFSIHGCYAVTIPQNQSFAAETSLHSDVEVFGPVMPQNFPDPCIINTNGTWTAMATNGDEVHMQVATSPDFHTWTFLQGHDALPHPPEWVVDTMANIWAPDLFRLENGTFVLYFSAGSKAGNGSHCVGAGYSDNAEGPYTPLDDPIVCNLTHGGAIDASAFRDWEVKGKGWGYEGDKNVLNTDEESWTDPAYFGGGKGGQRYMLYKVDGNSIGHGGACGNTVKPIVPTPIMLQAVDNDDGVTPIGNPIQILDNIGSSDEGIVEGPSLVKTPDGKYVLFFSSGCFSSSAYAQQYAVADQIQGPYTRMGKIFQTGDIVSGKNLTAPGGADAYWDGYHMVFHGNNPGPDTRSMYGALVNIIQGKVEV